jgi:CxxC motif-containing protein
METNVHDMICISCPLGCHLTVTMVANDEVVVEGNRCSRGLEYGREEMLSPKRVVTATVALKDGVIGRVPVKTDKPLSKKHIPTLLSRLYAMELQAPIEKGYEIICDIEGSGVNLVITRSIGKK